MKIFAAGIATETNTFCPFPTGMSDFTIQRHGDRRGSGTVESSFDLREIWEHQAHARGASFEFSLMAWAQPSGITLKSTYESIRDEMLTDLQRSMPVDVVLLMLHGAMIAYGYESCEEDILYRVRQIVGPNVVVGVELDLHCHLRDSLLALANLIITYKEYPHVDVNERAHELLDLAVDTRLGRVRPTMALFDCRMMGLYPTSRPPLRQLVDDMMAAESRPGVLSISFGHGFQFADIPGAGAKVLAITDGREDLARSVAREFGMRVYRLRGQIGFESVSLPLGEALQRASTFDRGPVVVADQSDNVGCGAPGDATFALRWLLDHGAPSAALAIVYDPEVARLAAKAGQGAQLSVRLGGKLGPSSGEPIDLEVTVIAVREDYIHELPQRSGSAISFRAGTVASLRHAGIDIVVSSERCQCVSPQIFVDLEIDPTLMQILIPKSSQHFYGAFSPIARAVIYMSAPGAVAPDPRLLQYRRLLTDDMYPWAADPLVDQPRAV
jgi:microcystin degradation protein MlrC